MRCYQPQLGSDEGACGRPARYAARLNWTSGDMYLCEDHAREEREHGDVIEIRSLGHEKARVGAPGGETCPAVAPTTESDAGTVDGSAGITRELRASS